MTPTPTTFMLAEALAYLERGWRVLPLHEPTPSGCTCRAGAGCTSTGKHPRVNWPPGQAVTPDTVLWWWRKWPTANVGIVTGAVSGLLVLDVDPDHGGWKSLRLIERRYGTFETKAVTTGGGGMHLYFRHPGVTIGPSAGKLGDGLDIRCDRGLVVAPPSLHKSGRRYDWAPGRRELGDTPRWLVRALLPPPPRPPRPVYATDTTKLGRAILERATDKVRAASDGAKHDVLWRQAFHLGTWVGAGVIHDHEARSALLHALRGRVDNGGMRAAEQVIDRCLREGARQPAEVRR